MTDRSVTTWNRLEPSARDRSMADGIEAPIADPLWLLFRQWQVGEFRGTDGGSIAEATLSGSSAKLRRYRPEGGAESPPAAIEYDPGTDPPLEVLAERESLDDDGGDGAAGSRRRLRDAVMAGQQFLRLINRAGLSLSRSQLRPRFGLTVEDPDPADPERDPESKRFGRVVSGRSLDGDELYETLSQVRDGVAVSDLLPIGPAADAAAYRTVVERFLDWYESRYNEPPTGADAWDDTDLAYGFSVAARTQPDAEPPEPPEGGETRETVFTARSYAGGRLDWEDFDVAEGASLGTPASAAATSEIDLKTLPSPVTFRGAPADRWWEFEDAAVDVNRFDVDRTDLPRLLLAQFLLDHGGDSFAIPVDVPVGSHTTIKSLTVVDTFDDPTSITAASREKPWRLFTLSTTDGGAVPGLFVPPTVADERESDPVESVRIARDEGANLGWAIERFVESPVGTAVDRTQPDAEVSRGQTPAFADEDPDVLRPGAPAQYDLSSDVPAWWYPLVPTRDSSEFWLYRGVMFDADAADLDRPRGRILGDGRLRIRTATVPRAGLELTRRYQQARGPDGATYLWSGRQKRPGAGEVASGLQFDSMQMPDDEGK